MEKISETDDKIRQLMGDLQDGMSLADGFMKGVERGLETADLVTDSYRKRERSLRVVAIAAGLCGVVCGVILTLIYPYMLAFVHRGLAGVVNIFPAMAQSEDIVAYGLISMCSIMSAIGSYRLLLSLPSVVKSYR